MRVGQSYRRSEWNVVAPPMERFDFNGSVVQVSPNYLCHGKYGPEQDVEFRGWLVCMWAKGGGPVTSQVVSKRANIKLSLPKMYRQVNAMCRHLNSVELSANEARMAGVTHFGNCFHVYRCQECKKVYTVDSSG